MRALVALLAIAACHSTPRPVAIAPLPAGAYAHYLNGKYALYREDAASAVSELTLAAQAAPDQPVVTVELARALAKAKRRDDARGVLQTARQRWPEHAEVWLASGEVLEADGTQPATAMAAYRRAIALEPADERAYLGLARVQLSAKDAAGAEHTLRMLVSKQPESIDGHYRLAQRLAANGKADGAIAELRAVLERDPDHLDARIDLARMLRRNGHLDEAVVQTRSAFDRAGQPMDLAEELYWLLCEADDRQGAIDLLTLLDDDRSDADALASVAHYNLGLGRIPEARTVAQHIKTLDADASTITVAEVDAADGKVEPAMQSLLAIAEASPRYVAARRTAVELLLAAQRPALALELLAPLRTGRADDLELHFLEGLAHAAAGHTAEAHAAATALAGKDPARVAFLRARILDRLGDQAAALAAIEPLARGGSSHLGVLNLTGYLLAQRKERLADAERYLRAARDQAPGDPAILDSWGFLLLQSGRTREAVRVLDHALRFAPREAEIAYHLAAAWAADGAPRMAAEILERAAALHPAPDVARRIDALRKSLGLR